MERSVYTVARFLHSHSHLLPPPSPLPLSVVPGVFGNQLEYCIDVIKHMMEQALRCPQQEVKHRQRLAIVRLVCEYHFLPKVYSEAFKAATAFVVFLETPNIRNRFVYLLPLLLTVCLSTHNIPFLI